jgi:ubiquitin conjugation factor E4 B
VNPKDIPFLGFFFNIFFPSFKSRQQCFSDASTRRPSDLLSSFTTIKTVMNTLYDGLSEVLRNLLRSTDTRENVLEYLAEVINLNASRAHIQVNFFLLHLKNKA